MNEAATTRSPRHAQVTSWLGLLFVLVFALNSLGGWVRLSGSGVAIPHWPAMALEDGTYTLLPPVSDAGWASMARAWQTHQDRLWDRVRSGELAPHNLGRQPADLAEFRVMVLTEWSHRALAAFTGLVGLVLVIQVGRDRLLRRQVGGPVTLAGALIIVQAVLGGLLVEEGTSTRWLFLHQANAAGVMAALLWGLLRLLDGSRLVAPPAMRRPLAPALLIAALMCWVELMFGALVSSTKILAQPGLPNGLGSIVDRWDAFRPVTWNLLLNPEVHQWVHRWWAWSLVAVVAAAFVLAPRSHPGQRLRLTLPVIACFLMSQAILGLGAAAIHDRGGAGLGPVLLALAHQALGMALFLSLVLAWFDARHEAPAPAATPAPEAA